MALLLSHSSACDFDAAEPLLFAPHWARVANNDAGQSSAFGSRVYRAAVTKLCLPSLSLLGDVQTTTGPAVAAQMTVVRNS